MTLDELIEGLIAGTISPDDAHEFLRGYGFVEVGFHRLDQHRSHRGSIPEVVLGLSKTIEQLRTITTHFLEKDLPLLITKLDATKGGALAAEFPALTWVREAGIMRRGSSPVGRGGSVTVISAGSSDHAVAEEAAQTLDFFGVEVQRVYDCGVAGLHRLFAAGERIESADVLIVVAGMEGALPSVVGGIFRQPIIAVPTSVGYGASFNGLAALLGMLNSCAPGVSVVNIDNGFGAAVSACAILQAVQRKATSPAAAAAER